MRLGILGSTRGTHLHTLVNAIQSGELHSSIELVISNKPDAIILQSANIYGLSGQFIDPTNLTREAYDEKISSLLHQYDIQLLVLAGYMRLLSTRFVKEWKDKIINVHPSLLPAFAGLMDLDVHRSVLAANQKTTGCTVHYVTEEVDAGPILVQKSCPVLSTDTPESLKARVQGLEAEALVAAIQLFSE